MKAIFIVGVIHSSGAVFSKRFNHRREFLNHSDLWHNPRIKWRWDTRQGLWRTIASEKLSDEDIFAIEKHLKRKYKIDIDNWG